MTARAKAHREPILSARGIAKRFGKQAVRDKLSHDILRRKIIGIAGGSGSGKSVPLKTLVGLRQPDSGEVLLNGNAVEVARSVNGVKSVKNDMIVKGKQ